jgi:flagellar L-ring protein precursor FlgH
MIKSINRRSTPTNADCRPIGVHRRSSAVLKGVTLLVFAVLAGCNPAVQVREPTSARPDLRGAPPRDGAIFSDASYRPLFEDRRARIVGDTITIQLNERLNASKKGSSNAERTSSAGVAIPLVTGLPGKTFQGAGLEAETSNKFEGKGATEASNLLTGTITVTVTEVLPNGNMVVSGEKQIGISKNAELIRVSGVVNPANIMPGNTVSSTQLADARIDYRSAGYIDEAQMMGWLSRFFNVFLPF